MHPMRIIVEKTEQGEIKTLKAIIKLNSNELCIVKEILGAGKLLYSSDFALANDSVTTSILGYYCDTEEAFISKVLPQKKELEDAIKEVKHFCEMLNIAEKLKEKVK